MTRPNRGAAVVTAILLAAGFVVLRVLYRVVFGGGDGGGTVLVWLPRIPLGGPFEGIVLFGEVTTGGVANAALSALPFAALVLVIGLLAAVIDLRVLLTRGAVRGPVRSVSRALVVAWATFPALVATVRRVRLARELRGERGIASLIVPVLEQTVERAIGLGASMEVRGFAATGRVEPVCERPAVIRDAELGYDDGAILAGIDLDLAPGTLTLVTGATGSGKSTLLHALSGLFQHAWAGRHGGSIEVVGSDRATVPPRETASAVGVVSQSVRLSFVAPTVADELGFALVIRGVAPVIVQARVEEIADRLGIRPLLGRGTDALSAGEATLVAIAAALIERPVLLLVDEPLADLDEAARSRVIDALDRLAHDAGMCVVVVEHALDEWGARPDAWLEVSGGRVTRVPGPPLPSTPETVVHGPIGERVASITHVSVRHGDHPAVADASFELRAGELVALRGPNGAGKSSLLAAIARPAAATVVVDGIDVHSLRRRARRRAVALVPEAFDDLLFATTVAAECRRADRRNPASATAELFVRLAVLGAEERGLTLARHPRDLSAGQRLCLVLAIQLSARPRVLLVDEPTRGMDAASRALIGAALVETAAAGTAVVMATHDRSFAARYATRTITMAAGRLAADIEVPS